jgi:hypothetical protein
MKIVLWENSTMANMCIKKVIFVDEIFPAKLSHRGTKTHFWGHGVATFWL